MTNSPKRLDPAKAGVAVALTFVAGYVDALGWLTLNRVFTAQMSGNTVLLAVHIAAGDGGQAWLQADAIAGFFAGLVISGSIIEIGMRRRLSRIFVAALAVELLMLVAFAAAAAALPPGGIGGADLAGPLPYVLVAIVAFAMGTQDTSLRMAGIVAVFTTHVTGALTGFSEEIIVCAFSLFQPRTRQQPHGGFASDNLRERHPIALRNMARSAALLTGFFVGALAGARLFRPVGFPGAIVVPLALLIAVGIFDWVVPLTVFPSPPERE